MARLKRWATCVALVLGTRAASAEPPPAAPPVEHVARFVLVVDEQATPLEACGGSAALQRAIERRLGRDVFTDAAGADVSLAIAIDPLPNARWQVHIAERDRTGAEVGHREVVVDAAERSGAAEARGGVGGRQPPKDVDAEVCARGIDTLAVVLAIMIGPPRTISGPAISGPAPEAPPVSLQESESGSSPAKPRAVPSAPRPTPVSARANWSVAPVAGVVVGSGILPGISWGVEGGLLVRPPTEWLAFIARAQVWPQRAGGTRPEVYLDRTSLSLLGCHRIQRSGITSVALCTGLDGGWLDASAPSIRPTKNVRRLLLDIPFEARIGLELPRLHRYVRLEPTVAAQLAVLLRRDRFIVQDSMDREATLHRSAPIALSLTVGLAAHFD